MNQFDKEGEVYTYNFKQLKTKKEFYRHCKLKILNSDGELINKFIFIRLFQPRPCQKLHNIFKLS